MNNDYELIKIKEKIYDVKNKKRDYYVTGFISLSFQLELTNLLNKEKIPFKYLNTGERKVLLISYEDINLNDQITVLKINTHENLKHNDIMGAILNIGIKREIVGNIYVKDNYLVEVLSRMKEYVIENLNYVSSYKVTLEEYNEKIPEVEFTEKHVIVSSLRLDNVVSSVFNMSRDLAKKAIINKLVFLNFNNELKADQRVSMNTYLSCKRKGKVIIEKEIGKSRKDNIILLVKYFNKE